VDYTFFGINDATQPNAPVEAMQFGRLLERFIRQIVLANPRYGDVKMIKVDLADGFYRIWLRPGDTAKLAVAFSDTTTDSRDAQ
jgi:lysophospholipase L1-like esterase